MLRLLASVASFLAAFATGVPALVAIHTFFADVPFDPLLGEGGVAVLLYFYFGIAAFGAGASLSLQGISGRRMILLGVAHLAVLLTAIEAYIIVIERFAVSSGLVELVIAIVVNLVLVGIFFRVALNVAGASDQGERRASQSGTPAV